MFTIIGGDGKEYGPVSLEQLRAWLAAGRANAETKARKIGEEQWQRLGDIPEFAHPGAVPPPVGAEAVGAVDPKLFADDLIARAAPLDIGGCLERGWELLRGDFWALVGVTFVVIAAMTGAGLIPSVGIFINLLLGGVFYGGLYFYYLRKLRGQPAEIGDAFSGFSLALVPLMLASFVSAMLALLGLAMLILPGIYLIVAYGFTFMLVIDKKMPFWTAMEVSRRVITAQWWRVFGLLILGVILTLLGMAMLFVGVFVTIPIFLGAMVCAYEALCNPPPK